MSVNAPVCILCANTTNRTCVFCPSEKNILQVNIIIKQLLHVTFENFNDSVETCTSVSQTWMCTGFPNFSLPISTVYYTAVLGVGVKLGADVTS